MDYYEPVKNNEEKLLYTDMEGDGKLLNKQDIK